MVINTLKFFCLKFFVRIFSPKYFRPKSFSSEIFSSDFFSSVRKFCIRPKSLNRIWWWHTVVPGTLPCYSQSGPPRPSDAISIEPNGISNRPNRKWQKYSNGQKIARMARILMIVWWNRSSQRTLSFQKLSNRRKITEPTEPIDPIGRSADRSDRPTAAMLSLGDLGGRSHPRWRAMYFFENFENRDFSMLFEIFKIRPKKCRNFRSQKFSKIFFGRRIFWLQKCFKFSVFYSNRHQNLLLAMSGKSPAPPHIRVCKE